MKTLGALLVLACMVGCDAAPQAPPQAARAQDRPVAPTATPAPSLPTPTANASGTRIPVLFLVGETLGWIEPCGCTEGMLGGLARRVAYYKQLRAMGYEPLVYDLGDFFDAPGPESDLKLSVLSTALDRLDIRGAALGELDLPAESRRSSTRDGQWMPGLSTESQAQVRRDLTDLHREKTLTTLIYDVLARGAARRNADGGAIAALQAISLLSPGLVPDDDDSYRRQLDALAGPLPPLVLYHGPRDEARRLFADRHDVAVVFSGHGDEIPLPPERLPGGAWLVEAGTKGKFVEVVEMRAGPASATGNARWDVRPWPPTPLDDRVPDDPEIADAIKKYRQDVFNANLVTSLPKEPTTGGHFVGPAACKDCHPRQYEAFQAMKHSHALDALRAKNATRDPECLRCHTTGFGFESGFAGEDATPDLARVSCESCHGVGSNHIATLSIDYGRMSDEASRALCARCHDHENSPRFDFKTYWEKIKH